MRLLFVLGFPNPFVGAAWTRIGLFAKAWSQAGHDVTILGVFTPNTFQKKGVTRVGKVNIFNIIFNLSLSSPFVFALNSLFSFIISLLFLLFKRPDIAIVSLPTGDVGLGALAACRLTKVEYVIDYRDEWEDYYISLSKSNAEKYFYSVVKNIAAALYSKAHITAVVTSRFLANLACRRVSNLKMIPNGADLKVFYPRDKSEIRKKLELAANDFIVVYNGLIGGYYDLNIIVNSIGKLKSSIENIRFLIVGNGPDVQAVLSLAQKLGLQDTVIYLGEQKDPNRIAEILSAADIGIIPGSYSKGQLSVKFYEYCACGLPVIAIVPEDSSLASIINEQNVGSTISSANENELSQVIYQFYINPLFRKAAGKRGIKFIEDKFDRNKIAEQYFDLIKDMEIKSS